MISVGGADYYAVEDADGRFSMDRRRQEKESREKKRCQENGETFQGIAFEDAGAVSGPLATQRSTGSLDMLVTTAYLVTKIYCGNLIVYTIPWALSKLQVTPAGPAEP